MPLSITLSHLYVDWLIHDGKPSKYAALLTFMNVWLWDGKNEEYFPMSQATLLADWTEIKDREIRSIALTAMVFMAMRFEDRLPKDFVQKYAQMADNIQLKEELIEIQKYLLSYSNIKQWDKSLNNDILNRMQEEQQRIQQEIQQVDDEDTRLEIAHESAERLSPYINKITEMVNDGADINLRNFIALRSLDIFNDVKNWFIDFDVAHLNMDQTNEEKKQIINLLLKHAELCDVDKYAMASVINKATSLQQIGGQIPDNIPHNNKVDSQRNAYKYCAQTLYRFFNFSVWQKEVKNPFQLPIYLSDNMLLAPMVCDKFLIECSKLFIKNNIWGHASLYLRSWMQHNEENNEVLKLFALCCKNLGEKEEQLNCLLKLEKSAPDDLYIVKECGICLMLAGRHEEAQKRFFHLEIKEKYLRTATRGIAWCSLLTGNILRAKRYYQKLLRWEGGASWNDTLNAAHCAFVSGNPSEASNLYNRYIEMHDDNLEAFNKDIPTLLSLGITHDEIDMMKSTLS